MTMAKAETLTAALAKSQLRLLTLGRTRSSNSREIPYWEVYRGSSAERETPAERLQRIATEEERAEA